MQPAPIKRTTVQARWLLWLRWFAVIGQLLTVLVARTWLGIQLPLTPLMAVIGFTALTNFCLEFWLRRQAVANQPFYGRATLLSVMALDLVLLTILLYFSGGVSNPFVVFYFVNVALSAAILPAPWAWASMAGAVACAGILFFQYVPLEVLESDQPADVAIRRQGLMVALATCGFVVTYFITRVTSALREREQQLFAAEQQRLRSERLESLATLAAGAGHELASPLSTIAVIAGELSHHLEGTDVPDTVLEDVALIRTELAHCRSILDRMSGHAGEAAGEGVEELSLQELLEEVLEGMRHPERVELQLDSLADVELRLPAQAVAQAMRGVVQNGLDASPDGQPVTITAKQSGAMVTVRVVDRGNGMSSAVLRRVGEPFFTTKETGKGMGLGLFLTRGVLERIGGSLRLESAEGRGTTASIDLPVFDGAA